MLHKTWDDFHYLVVLIEAKMNSVHIKVIDVNVQQTMTSGDKKGVSKIDFKYKIRYLY